MTIWCDKGKQINDKNEKVFKEIATEQQRNDSDTPE